MINLKQTELSHQLFDQLKQQYPEINLVDIVESGVYPDHLWVKIVMPEDEEREITILYISIVSCMAYNNIYLMKMRMRSF